MDSFRCRQAQQIVWCTRKLLTQAVEPHNYKEPDLQQNSLLLSSSTKNKQSHLTGESSGNKPKINRSFKTQVNCTPEKNVASKIQIYSQKCSPPCKKSINNNKYSQLSSHKQSSKNKTKVRDSRWQLLPSQRTVLLSNSASKSNTISSILVSKPEAVSPLKSKKIHFTVYDNKSNSRRSKSKQQMQPKQKPLVILKEPSRDSSTFSMHRFTDITIDLSKPKREAAIIKQASTSKSSKSVQKTFSLKKQDSLKRCLKNSKQKIQKDPRVKRTLQKIKSYRFVDEHMSQSQIEQLIQGYQRNGEPQCRWALLVVDQVFRKMRSGPTLQCLVAKP